MTCCPSAVANLAEIALATMSPAPPAGFATTRCTGRSGKFCARTHDVVAKHVSPMTTATAARALGLWFIKILLLARTVPCEAPFLQPQAVPLLGNHYDRARFACQLIGATSPTMNT